MSAVRGRDVPDSKFAGYQVKTGYPIGYLVFKTKFSWYIAYAYIVTESDNVL